MNTRSALIIKVRTLKQMQLEFETEQLTEPEIEDMHILTDEMRDLAEEYLVELGPEEILKRLGPDHWMVNGDGIESDPDCFVLQGIEDLLGLE